MATRVTHSPEGITTDTTPDYKLPETTHRLELGTFRFILYYTHLDHIPDKLEIVTQSGDSVEIFAPTSNPDLIEEIFDQLSICPYDQRIS